MQIHEQKAYEEFHKKLKDKDLKDHGIRGKLFIAESMAPAYKNLDWKCRQLKKGGAIQQ